MCGLIDRMRIEEEIVQAHSDNTLLVGFALDIVSDNDNLSKTIIGV